MNFADLIVAAAIIGIAVLAIGILRRNKKNGKCSCGCDRGCCSQDCQKK